jgi:hypothetical protein
LPGVVGVLKGDRRSPNRRCFQDGEIAAVSRAKLPVLAILRWGLSRVIAASMTICR